jgi:hypothetical protein
MDLLGDPLTTRPIQMGWEFTMEPYPSGQFWLIDIPDRQFGNTSVCTRTRTWSDGLEPVLTLGGKCLTIICFSWPGFMGSKVQRNITFRYNWNRYMRPSFRRRSLLASIFSTKLLFIHNHQLNWSLPYYHLFVHIRCWRMDLHLRQWIWVLRVGHLARNNPERTMWEHQIILV